MKKVFCLIVTITVVLISMTIMTLAQAQAPEKVYQWKFSTNLPAGSTSYAPLKDFLEKRMAKATNGRLQISLYPAGSLVPTQQLFQAVRRGTLDGAKSAPLNWMTIVPCAAATSNLPMSFLPPDEALHLYFDLGLEDIMKKAHAKYNMRWYTQRLLPTAMMGKRPILKIDDFKGYKIRSSGLIANMLNELGASTSFLPGEEIYMAISTGVVEGTHWGAAAGALGLKIPEVAKYYMQPNLAMDNQVFLVNQDSYNALPKDLQQIVEKEFRDRAYWRTHDYAKDEDDALKLMIKKYGVQVNTLPPADAKKMRMVGVNLWDKVAAKDDDSAKAIAIMKKYFKERGYID